MAGNYSDLNTLGTVLKEAYPKKALETLLNQETPFRKALKSNLPAGSKVTQGKVKFGTILDTPQNVGQIADDSSLIIPKDRTQRVYTLHPTMFTGGFKLGWMTRAALNSSGVTFTNGGELQQRTEETLKDMGKYIEQTYVAGDGTGVVAESAGGGSTTTDILEWPWGTRLMRVGRLISVRTAAGGDTVGGAGNAGPDGCFVVGINDSTRTITFSKTFVAPASAVAADAASADGEYYHVVTDGTDQTGGSKITGITSINATAFGLTANGLRGLVNNGTGCRYIHGLDRQLGGNEKLSSIVASNGGTRRNLTEQLLINTCHRVNEATGKRVTDIWCNYGQVEKYIEFVAPDRRYVVNGGGTQGMGTGYKGSELVHYAPGVAMKFNVSFDMLPREMFLLNWDSFFLYVAQELDWWDAPMLKPTPTSGGFRASYQAHLASVENIACDMPLANAVIQDLKDPICSDV